MILPLIPTLALLFIAFIAAAFVILRIIIPILPPHPLSRRVSPAEFGLPNFRSLTLADKGHLWLVCCITLTLALLPWQAFAESNGDAAGFATAKNPVSTGRLWIMMTLVPTCLLVMMSSTLVDLRRARSTSFGVKHWIVWVPTSTIVVISTAIACTLAAAGISSLFIGLAAYMVALACLNSGVMTGIVFTLLNIKRNLALSNEDNWPPMHEGKPRPSFATEDIDALRDGASWITSNASSRHSARGSISAWSFSTYHTAAPSRNGHGQMAHPAKNSFWFGSTQQVNSIPPVPPLPAPYGPLSPTAESLRDVDPFARNTPSPQPHLPRDRLGSQASWLTSTSGSHPTVSAWSFPTAAPEGSIFNGSSTNLQSRLLPQPSRPATPAMANAQVLGGYGYVESTGPRDTERGLSALAAPMGTTLDISPYRLIGWLISIWSPLAFAYPYLLTILNQNSPSTGLSLLFVLSVIVSSPILAANILLRSPLPIPEGLFDFRSDSTTTLAGGSSRASTMPASKWSHEYKQSTAASVTVIEGRRSGDVWLANGDAMDGKSKSSRAFSMLAPRPKLSVLPVKDEDEDGELTPPLPMQNEDSMVAFSAHQRSHSETSAQFGRLRKDSKASSFISGVDESLAYNSRIVIAQRHYSALAKTVHVSTSPQKMMEVNGMLSTGVASGVAINKRTSGHLRTRSVSSMNGPKTPNTGDSFSISPPPSMPLPPTPPTVRAIRLGKHKKSFSSGFSFGPVDDMNEIDALTAGVLPLLVPGLTVGSDMKIKEGAWSPPGTFTKSKGKKLAKMLNEFGGEFSSPAIHSTPARARPRPSRGRNMSAHKKNHMSLPSLGLGRDGNWSNDLGSALEKVRQFTTTPKRVDIGRRHTVVGDEALNNLSILPEVAEDRSAKALDRAFSTRSLGLRADVPHGLETARNSLATLNMIPPSAASTVTLFEFEADSGPQAESTPHNNATRHRISEQNVPPVPRTTTTPTNRRSSIVYIKSDDNAATITPPSASTTSSSMSTFAQWSSRAVRPLMPKSSKLLRKASDKVDSPGRGLRPLSLLKDRDPNVMAGSPVSPATRPLYVAKKKSKLGGGDENANPYVTRSKSKNLKQLQLVRSDTSKLRGVLREEEELPDVVVRPPSTSQHQGFAYRFGA